MRIAIDCRMYGNEECTGIGSYIESMTNALFKIDQENQYYLFMMEPAFSRFQPPNDHIKKIKVHSRWYTYAEQLILPFRLSEHSFDLIHYPHFNSPLLFRKKSVCTIHDVTPLFFPGHKMSSLFRRWAYRKVFKGTLRKAKQIIAVSESTKQGIIEHLKIKPEKIKVIHEGVDNRFQIIENNDIIEDTKRKFGISLPYIFFVGVWRVHKNIEGLIKAYNLLRTKYKIDCQLVLGGRADLHYTKVNEAIEKSPFKHDIITTGFISDKELPHLYNGARVFALPSYIEGFGLIGIEAQRCGCPVVSSNTSSLPEVLGDSALYFNPKKPEEIAQKLHQVLTDDKVASDLIAKGQKNAQQFTWEKCAKETLAVYKKILED